MRRLRTIAGMFVLMTIVLSVVLVMGSTTARADEIPDKNVSSAQPTDEQVTQNSDANLNSSDSVVWQGDGEMPAELEGISNPQHMWNNGAAQEAWEVEQQARGEQRGSLNGRASGGCYARVKWDSAQGTKRFTSAGSGPDCSNKKVFHPAWKVLDVSEHQQNVDWNTVKRSDVDAVILRTSFGYGFEDKQFARNLSEVRRLGIPFGVYHYSYAYNADFAQKEALWLISLLRKYNVKASDMALPVFYDLEQDDWGGHRMPKTASGLRPIVNTFTSLLSQSGYSRTHLYTYVNYASSRLNSADLLARIGWIAQYSNQLDFNFSTAYGDRRGWQYTSSEYVAGISSGRADMSAFAIGDVQHTGASSSLTSEVKPPTGNYTGWVSKGADRYWFENGRKTTNREIHTDANWYWVGSDGRMAKGVTLIPSGRGTKWVYYDIRAGYMRYGEQYLNYDREHTGWYNFNAVTGEMIKGLTHVSSNGGKTVYYDVITGKMQYGERYVNYGRSVQGWYSFDPVTGAMQKGVRWVPSSGGKWVYYDVRSGKMQYGSRYLNYDREHTGWYYFDPVSGKMAHGYTWVNGRLIYYDRVTGKRH